MSEGARLRPVGQALKVPPCVSGSAHRCVQMDVQAAAAAPT